MRRDRPLLAVLLGLSLVAALAGCDTGRPTVRGIATPPTPAAPGRAAHAFYVLDVVRDTSAPLNYHTDVVALAPDDGSILWRHHSSLYLGFQPEVLDGIVYTVLSDTTSHSIRPGFLEALDPASGTLLWRHKTDQPIHTVLTVQNGVVYASYGAVPPAGPRYWPTSFVEAISTHDGSRLWRTTVNGTPSAGAIANGTLYIALAAGTYAQPESLHGSLIAIDANTGALRWATPTDLPRGAEAGTFAPIVVNGMVYLETVSRNASGSLSDTVNAFSVADGRLIWHHPTASSASPLTVAGGLVVFDWYDARNAAHQPAEAIALDAATGSVRWRYTLPGTPTDPLVVGNRVYLSVSGTSDASRSGVLALRVRDGALLWRARAGQPADVELFSSPVAAGNLIAVFAIHNQNSKSVSLSVLRSEDGSHVWSREIAQPLQYPALMSQGSNFYVRRGTSDFSLRAFRASDGTLLWVYPL